MFTHEAALAGVADDGAVILETTASPDSLLGGTLRWIDGPLAGLRYTVLASDPDGRFVLDEPAPADLAPGSRATVREGCDHTLPTCSTRFGNAVNFRGEPFLPGNDLLLRYPEPTA